MKGLTAKEEEIMGFFWEKGPLFVKEMLAFYEEPKPHLIRYLRLFAGLKIKAFWLIILFWEYLSVLSRCQRRRFS